jgi:hypothetical protein
MWYGGIAISNFTALVALEAGSPTALGKNNINCFLKYGVELI